ncbi:MAG: sigma-70 family RNA polymerase sigma factor [Planctomycetota bacterium]
MPSSSATNHYEQTDPDVRLMLRVRDDDAAAFAELVTRYENRLIRLLRTAGPRPDLAEDLAQETFMRIFRARKRYEPKAKFSTWLFFIAGNVAKNAKRDNARRGESPETDIAGSSNKDKSGPTSVVDTAPEASGLMPTRLIENDERAEMVRQAVATLGERQRMALMLSRFENMSYQEIAESMDLTTKAVKSLLSRARVNLREALKQYIEMPSGSMPAVEEYPG